MSKADQSIGDFCMSSTVKRVHGMSWFRMVSSAFLFQLSAAEMNRRSENSVLPLAERNESISALLTE